MRYTVPLGRRLPLVILGFIALIDLVSITAGGPLFNILFSAAIVIAAYRVCWRMVSELVLGDEMVTWRTSLRSGVFSVHDLVRIEPGGWRLANTQRLVLSDGSKLDLIGGGWFRTFCDQLRTVRPEVPVTFNAQMQVQERLFRHRDG